MKLFNSTLNRGTTQLSRSKADNLKRSYMKRPAKPYKWKVRSHHNWQKMLDYIKARAVNRCERCNIKIPDPTPQNAHHIRARSHGGTDDPENLAFLCSPQQYYGRQDHSCHTWAHSNPIEARRKGWLK